MAVNIELIKSCSEVESDSFNNVFISITLNGCDGNFFVHGKPCGVVALNLLCLLILKNLFSDFPVGFLVFPILCFVISKLECIADNRFGSES